MRLAKRPVRDVNWPRLMSVMKVDFMGLKAAAWKYLASSHFVVSYQIMLLAWLGWERVADCCAGGLGYSGIFHRLLVWSRKPVMMT